jgi:putative membrane protein
MKIATSKTREQFPLSTKKIIKKTIRGTIAILMFATLILFLIGIGFLSSGTRSPLGFLTTATIITLVISFVISFLIYQYQRWYFAVYFYDLTPDYVQIKKGPITPREITIPYERIQDIYVDQDLLDRLFGIYDVHLSSATITSGFEAHIDGLEKQDAEGLRAVLLDTVKHKLGGNQRTQEQTVPQVNDSTAMS